LSVGRLPDFLVIGAFKSGTTSLAQFLGDHPQIYMPWLQEPNFFAYEQADIEGSPRPEVERNSVYKRHRARTLAQYESLFEEAPAGALVGECSPEYMRSAYACPRIAEELPNAKLLAILRNPIDRAFSDYQAFVRDSLERAPFGEAIRRPPGIEPGSQYVMTGFYGRQLQPYFETFGADRVKVILNEDLRVDAKHVLDDVCEWLGVDPMPDSAALANQFNVSGRPRNSAVALAYKLRRVSRPWAKPIVPERLQRGVDSILANGLQRESVPPAVRSELIEIYREDIELLQSLTGRDLGDWLRQPAPKATGKAAPRSAAGESAADKAAASPLGAISPSAASARPADAPDGPDFLVIGAAKSGTTSLSFYLRQHPDIFFAREKESHFFLYEGQQPDFRGPSDAEEFLPLIISDKDQYLECFAGAEPGQLRGEASVYYMSSPEALKRAIAHNPKMKFLAVLRNPAERSFSAWSHMMRDNREPVDDFLRAFGLEAERREADWSPGFFYESMSQYGEQLAACYEAVPAEQLKVVLYEDLVSRHEEALAEIFEFLGLQPVDIASERVMNASGNPRFRALNRLLTQRNPVKTTLKRVIPYEAGMAISQRLASWNLQRRDLSQEDRAVLTQRFSEDVARLEQILGRDLSAWSDSTKAGTGTHN
jgi:hypothetical protein